MVSPGISRQHHREHAQALHQCQPQRGAAEQWGFSVARRALHHVTFGRFVLERQRAGRIYDQLEECDVHWVQKRGPAEQRRQKRHARDGHMHRQDVRHRLAQVVEDAPAQPCRVHDGREIIVQQHQRCGFTGHVGAASAHRDADMGSAQRGRVVDAVASHRDDVAVGFQGLHDAQLLLRCDAGADADGTHAFAQGFVIKGVHLIAGQKIFGAFGQAGLLGDRARGSRIVAGNHQHADTGCTAFGDGPGHLRP